MDFNSILSLLLKSTSPEEVFGIEDPKKQYRNFSFIVHPDKAEDKEKAQQAFQILSRFWEQAEEKMSRHTYGKKEETKSTPNKIRIVSKKSDYLISSELAVGKLSIIYNASFSGKDFLLKVAKAPTVNDLLENETKNLQKIKEVIGENYNGRFPTLIETFISTDAIGQKRRVNVFDKENSLVTLSEVLKEFPDGVGLRTMAWIFNRCLSRLLLAHKAGIIHCSINPNHILIDKKEHNAKIIDWCYSIGEGHLKALDTDWKFLYAPEMSDKKVFHGSDIYMLAKTMILLCGGKVDGDIFYPKTFPPMFKAFFKSLLIKNPFRRYQSCGEVYDQFHDILIQTFGKPKFAEFGQ